MLLFSGTGQSVQTTPPNNITIADAVAGHTSSAPLPLIWPLGAPSPGNVLVVALVGNYAQQIATPAGWTALFSPTPNSNHSSTALFYKIAVLSEPTAVSFAFVSGNALHLSASMLSISGAAGTAPQWSEIAGTSQSLTTTGIVPSTLSSLAVAFFTAMQAVSAFTTPSGWTANATTASGYSVQGESQDALTSDTSTAIAVSSTFAGTNTSAFGYQLIVAPLAPSLPSIADGMHAGATTGSVTTQWPLGSPTRGNILIAVGITKAGDTIVTPLGGWLTLQNGPPIPNAFGMGLFFKIATINEPTSYLWTSASGLSNIDVTLASVTAAQQGEPQFSITGVLGASSIATKGIVPTSLNSLVIAGFVAGQAVTAFSVPTGWTSVASGHSPLASIIQARTALTSNTSTPISTTTVFSGTEQSAGAFGLIIAPSSALIFTKSFTSILDLAVFGQRLGAILFNAVVNASGALTASVQRQIIGGTIIQIGNLQKTTQRLTTGLLALSVDGARQAGRIYNLGLTAATGTIGALTRLLGRSVGPAALGVSAVLTQLHISRILYQALNSALNASGATVKLVARAVTAFAQPSGSTSRSNVLPALLAIIASVGGTQKTIRRLIVSTFGALGAFQRSVNAVFNGASTVTGALPKRLYRLLLAALGTSATLTFTKAKVLTFNAIVFVTSSIGKQTTRALTASIASLSKLANQTGVAVSSAFAFTALVSSLPFHFANLIGTFVSTSSITRALTRQFNSSIQNAALFAVTSANGIALFFGASTTLTSTAARNITALLASAELPVGTLAKTAGRSFAATINAFGNVLRRSGAKLTASSVAFMGTGLRTTNRPVLAKVLPQGAITRIISRMLTGAITPIAKITRSIQAAFTVVLTLLGGFTRYLNKTISGTTKAAAAPIIRTLARSLSGTVLGSGTITHIRALVFLGLTLVGAFLTRMFNRNIPSGSMRPSGSVVRQSEKNLPARVQTTAVISRVISAAFSAVSTLIGALTTFAYSGFAMTFSAATVLSGSVVHAVTHSMSATFTIRALISRALFARVFKAASTITSVLTKRNLRRIFAGATSLIAYLVKFLYAAPLHTRHRTIATPIINVLSISTPIYPGARESSTSIF